MKPLDQFLLGLLTEDEFALWEIEGYVSDESGILKPNSRQLARESLERLVNRGLVQLVRDTTEGIDESAVEQAPIGILSDGDAWGADHWTVRAVATPLGQNEYMAQGTEPIS